MELGKNLAGIIDYGLTKSKAGAEQVFIKFKIGKEETTWFGSPFRKECGEDGNPKLNDMFWTQFVYCGFDPEKNKLEDLLEGFSSDILITDEYIEVTIADEIQPDGDTKRRIKMIGEIGPTRLDATEAKQLLSSVKNKIIKEGASKFKARKRIVKPKKQDPSEPTPF